MSVTVSLQWTLFRSGLVAVLAVPIAGLLAVFLSGLTGRMRALAWGLLFVPFLTPVILVGYGWSSFSLSLVRWPLCNEILYDVLLLMRLVPVAALALRFAPRLLSEESLHCCRLLRGHAPMTRGLLDLKTRLLFFLHGPFRARVVAFAVVFLLAFGEFEMASLLNVRTWTVALFDAHAGGLLLLSSVRLALFPALIQTVVLLAVCMVLFGSRRSADGSSPSGGGAFPSVRQGPGRTAAAVIYLLLAVVMVTVVPLTLVLRQTSHGFQLLLENFVLSKPIGAGVFFGLIGGTLAYMVAGWFSNPTAAPGGADRFKLIGAFLLATPGLLGPLVLSLVVLYVFQLPLLRVCLDTPIPLALTLGLLVFPVALLLRLLLRVVGRTEALHEARLLSVSGDAFLLRGVRKLTWRLRGRPQFYVAFLLFCWAYFDMTSAALLAPAGMTPVFVWLYNLMHYGQSAALSAMVCVAFMVPVCVLCLALSGKALSAGFRTHG